MPTPTPTPTHVSDLTVLILTKNEATAIRECVKSALLVSGDVVVVDSHSDDGTPEVAGEAGARVLQFTWDGGYPKKKQWALEHPTVTSNWVMHLDADERVTPELAAEIQEALKECGAAAYEATLAYHFEGKRLRHGHRMHKRVLLRRDKCHFPEVDDLNAPGIGEVEGHYQPLCDGPISRLHQPLVHDDPDPLSTWIERHNKYSDWEAYLATNPSVARTINSHRTREGRWFARAPLKPLLFFIYSYIIRLGWRDGRPGLDFAVGLAWYYWLIGVKTRERLRLARAL